MGFNFFDLYQNEAEKIVIRNSKQESVNLLENKEKEKEKEKQEVIPSLIATEELESSVSEETSEQSKV